MPIDMPADYDAFKAAIVRDQETDSQGVYEVWWQANTWYPDQLLSTRLAMAEQVVRDLLDEGRVILVQGQWISPAHEREPVADVEAAIRAWATWVPDTDKPVVWMADA